MYTTNTGIYAMKSMFFGKEYGLWKGLNILEKKYYLTGNIGK